MFCKCRCRVTRLQEATLPPALQPSFEPCEKAYPRALPYGKSLARALRAHAVLFGNVTQGVSGYDVNTYVSDAYDIFAFPVPYANQSVNRYCSAWGSSVSREE